MDVFYNYAHYVLIEENICISSCLSELSERSYVSQSLILLYEIRDNVRYDYCISLIL